MSGATGTPKVIVNVASRNLRRQIKVLDGIAGIVGTTASMIGVCNKVNGLDDAIEKGYTLADEPFMYSQILQFYNELGGNQELWIMGVEDTMTMTQMCTQTNANGAKKLLLAAKGRINLLGICRQPGVGYDAGEDFLDSDVATAVNAAKVLKEYQAGINKPVRMIIEGRVVNEDEINTFEPNTANASASGVILGNDINDGSGMVGAVLGRACKYGAHEKIGNGLNGTLAINEAFIGSKPLDEFYPEELDALSDAGFIIPVRRDGSAGFYFGVDNMAGNDDFHILAHGRVIDKAHRIATATTTPFLESTVRVTSEGFINETDAKYLEDQVKSQIRAGMGDQISDVDCDIKTDQDIINSSNLPMAVSILPLGYLTWITINIGLTSKL